MVPFKRKEVISPPSGETKPRRDKKSPSYPQEFVHNLVIFIPEGNIAFPGPPWGKVGGDCHVINFVNERIVNEKRLYEAEANGLANNNASATTRP